MKTSLGIWAFGGMATRFNPGGYKPELVGASTAARVRTAVAGLADLIDDYEFHYPQELREDNLAEVQEALAGHGIYCVASGLHLDARFGRGGFCSPDDTVRGEALRLTREAVDLAGEVGARVIIWPGIEGYNYPFQTPYVIHTLRRQGLDNVQVNMDWQHLIMNGENLAEYAALLAAEGLLGHQHANSGWGTFDDDNMVGATAFMETLELAVELRR